MTTTNPSTDNLEVLSERIHKLYCVQYEKDHGEPYWTNGDYSKLEERVKEYDRNIARFIESLLSRKEEEVRKEVVEFIRSNSALSVRLYDEDNGRQFSVDMYETPAHVLEAAVKSR